jgi:apolipoprotein N-acyltransferase
VSPRTGLSIFAAVSQLRRVIFLAPLLIFGAWMMATALESPAYWWLGWVTLVPLLLSIKLLCTVDAGIAGAIWGMSLYFSTGSSDPGASAHVLPHGILPLLLLMLVPAGYAAAASEITRRKGFHPLLLGLGWVGVELAIHPLGIHHGLLAHTQGDSIVVQSVGNLGGYILIAFVIALVNGVVAGVLCEVGSGIGSGRSTVAPCSIRRSLFVNRFALPVACGIDSLGPRAPPFRHTTTS